MSRAITVGDVLLWAGAGLAIVAVVGVLLAILAAVARGMSR